MFFFNHTQQIMKMLRIVFIAARSSGSTPSPVINRLLKLPKDRQCLAIQFRTRLASLAAEICKRCRGSVCTGSASSGIEECPMKKIYTRTKMAKSDGHVIARLKFLIRFDGECVSNLKIQGKTFQLKIRAEQWMGIIHRTSGIIEGPLMKSERSRRRMSYGVSSGEMPRKKSSTSNGITIM